VTFPFFLASSSSSADFFLYVGLLSLVLLLWINQHVNILRYIMQLPYLGGGDDEPSAFEFSEIDPLFLLALLRIYFVNNLRVIHQIVDLQFLWAFGSLLWFLLLLGWLFGWGARHITFYSISICDPLYRQTYLITWLMALERDFMIAKRGTTSPSTKQDSTTSSGMILWWSVYRERSISLIRRPIPSNNS
jgi:hypothetical protein